MAKIELPPGHIIVKTSSTEGKKKNIFQVLKGKSLET
jgi:hypothetical protein